MVTPIVSAHSCLTFSGKVVLACLELGLVFLEAVSLVYCLYIWRAAHQAWQEHPQVKGKKLKHASSSTENWNLLSCAQRGNHLSSLAVV